MKGLYIFILGLIIIVYNLVGGAIFMALESDNETTTRSTTLETYRSFLTSQTCLSEAELETFVRTIISAYDQGIIATQQTSSGTQWDFGNSVFFSMTVITTIGYGNQTPVTAGGRVFVIFFGIFGIVLCGLFLANLGEKITGLEKRAQARQISKNHPVAERRLKKLIIPLVGICILFFLPAGIFTAIEGWTYGESLYYCVVTLTTIGFGDFVIGTGDVSQRVLYRLLGGVWIYIGLAWVAALISSLTETFSGVGTEITAKFEKNEKGNKVDEEGKDDSTKNEKDTEMGATLEQF